MSKMFEDRGMMEHPIYPVSGLDCQLNDCGKLYHSSMIIKPLKDDALRCH